MIERKKQRKAKIGLFAVVHGVYFDQFEGLYEKLTKYHSDLAEKLRANEVEVMDLGMIDSNAGAFEAADKFNGEAVDLIICNMITYATSSVFAPVLKNATAPMILTALQPREAMDYTKASTFMQLENDNICSVPEFMGVAARMNKKIYDVIIGVLYGDEEAEARLPLPDEVAQIITAA